MTLHHATMISDAPKPAVRRARRSAVQKADLLRAAEWDDALREFPDATPFHSPAWLATLQSCYGFNACCVRLRAAGMTVVAPLFEVSTALRGRRGIALPFTDFCEPLCAGELDAAEGRAQLLQFGRERGWRSLEVRGGGSSLFRGENSCARFVTHEIDLAAGEDSLWTRCHSSVQRAVRKARAAGVAVRRDASASAVREFHRLQCMTRRKHGLPPQPARFFHALREHALEGGGGDLYLAEHGGRTVAGAVFLSFGSSVIFKFGASDERHLHLRANHLVLWQAISDYARAGFTRMNLGRTEANHAGLRQYKRSFGAGETGLGYHRFDYAANAFEGPRAGGLLNVARPFLRRLPLPLLRVIGALLYRHAA